MTDLRLIEDGVTGEFDLSISPTGDFEAAQGLETAVLVSLLTDGRAADDEVTIPEYRRGWIGDAEPIAENYQIGSKLWLVEPTKATQQTVVIAASRARDALSWLTETGIAANVEVQGQITGPREAELQIRITAPDGTEFVQFLQLWQRTFFAAGQLPAREIEIPPFTPATIPDLLVWGDAEFSSHDIDGDCGVITARDLAENADYFQADAAKRPKRLEGSGGWLYRFDGTDDHLATLQQPFTPLRQGTFFFTYKPTDNAAAGRRIFAVGVSGQADNVGGMAFTQQAADIIQVLAANNSFDVSVLGPSSADGPVGVVVRWGPAFAGADIETTDGQSDSDPSYNTDIPAPLQLVLGAGHDGVVPDDTQAAGFESNVFAAYNRRVSDLEVVQLLDYGASRAVFTSPVGEPFDDCRYFTDDQGFIDG